MRYISMNELHEVYDAKVGDVMTFSYDHSLNTVCQEIVENDKLASVERGLENWVVKFVSVLPPREWVDLLINAKVYEKSEHTVRLNKLISADSFRITLYNRFKELEIKRTIKNIGGLTLKIIKREDPVDINSILDSLSEKDFKEFTFKNIPSTMQLLYKGAKKRDIKIKIKQKSRFVLEIMKIKKKDPDLDLKPLSDFHYWLAGLPFDTPVRIPVEKVNTLTDKEIRIKLHNSLFDTSYRGGLVTKKQFCVRVIKGEVCLRVNSQTIHIFRDINLVSQMTEAHYKLANTLLAPYGGSISK